MSTRSLDYSESLDSVHHHPIDPIGPSDCPEENPAGLHRLVDNIFRLIALKSFARAIRLKFFNLVFLLRRKSNVSRLIKSLKSALADC